MTAAAEMQPSSPHRETWRGVHPVRCVRVRRPRVRWSVDVRSGVRVSDRVREKNRGEEDAKWDGECEEG